MTPKNNLSPLAFHSSLSEQNQNLWYAYGHTYTFNYLLNYVPPFQIIIEDDTEPTGVLPDTWFLLVALYPVGYPIGFDVKNEMITNQGLKAEKFDDGYIVVSNPSTNPISVADWNPQSVPGWPTTAPPGNIYLRVNNHYSEQWSWTDDVSRQVVLKYKHGEDILLNGGKLDFSNDFEFQVNFKTTIGKPEYLFDEDVKEREGKKFYIHQLSYKKFKFEFFAAEYLVDALRIVRMMDDVVIESDGKTYDVETILFTVAEWNESGHMARVICEFETDTVIVNSGRAIQP